MNGVGLRRWQPGRSKKTKGFDKLVGLSVIGNRLPALPARIGDGRARSLCIRQGVLRIFPGSFLLFYNNFLKICRNFALMVQSFGFVGITVVEDAQKCIFKDEIRSNA